ncbi:hypothetical protein EJB05_04914, partial [Eragrostis curvula]
GRREEGVGGEEGQERRRGRRVATGAARGEEAREREERVEVRPRRARRRGGRGRGAAAAGGEPRELVGEEEIRVRGHQVAELVERLHSGGNAGQIMRRIRGAETTTRGAEMRSSPPFPLWFFSSTDARAIGGAEDGGGGGGLGGWLVLIFSVDSAAECWGTGRAAGSLAERGKGRRNATTSMRGGGRRRRCETGVPLSELSVVRTCTKN